MNIEQYKKKRKEAETSNEAFEELCRPIVVISPKGEEETIMLTTLNTFLDGGYKTKYNDF
jgi:hypothetical protein